MRQLRTKNIDLDELFRTEGTPWIINRHAEPSGATTSGTQQFTKAFNHESGFNPGKLVKLNEVLFQCSGPGLLLVIIRYGRHGQQGSLGYQNNAGCTLNYNFGAGGGVFRQSFDKVYLYDGADITISWTDLSTTQAFNSFTASGLEITNDLNVGARYTYLSIGDSITWWGMGTDSVTGKPYMGRDHYTARLARQLVQDGKDIRCIRAGFGGATSEDLVHACYNGLFDGKEFDLLTIGIGTNDATGQGVSVANFTANVQAVLAWKAAHWSDRVRAASVVLLGAPATDVATRAPYIQSYRDALASLADSTSRIYYYDQSTAFGLNATAASDVNYRYGTGSNNERVAGSRTHISGIGHGLIAAGLYEVVQTTHFYQNS